MKVRSMLKICIPFIESMIVWVNKQIAMLVEPDPYLENMRKEFLAIRAAMLDKHENPNYKEIGNVRELVIKRYNDYVSQHPDYESDSSDSVVEIAYFEKNSKKKSKKKKKCVKKGKKEKKKREPDLSKIRHISDFYYMQNQSVVRVRNYLIDKLEYLVEYLRKKQMESVLKAYETEERSLQDLNESETTNNTRVLRTRKDIVLLDEDTCHYLKFLYRTVHRSALIRANSQAGSQSGSIPQVVEDKKSTKWPRVVMHKINLNSLKYARRISETCLIFTHRPGFNRAFRSSKIWKSREGASTSKAGTSKKSMTLRSDTNKKVNEQNNAKEKNPPSRKNSKANSRDSKKKNARKTSKTRPKRKKSPTKSRRAAKKRPAGRPKGPKSANNASETERDNPDHSNSNVEEYHKFKKRRRLMSQEADENNSQSSQETSNPRQNAAQRKKPSKKATNSEETQEPENKNQAVSNLESDDSFGGTTEEDTETVSDEEPRTVFTLRGDESRDQNRNDDNSSSAYDASTDEGPPSEASFRDDESRDQCRNDDSLNAIYDAPTDEEPQSEASFRDDESRDQCENDENSNALYDAPTDEDVSSASSFREEDSQEPQWRIENVTSLQNLQTDENYAPEFNFRNEEPQQNAIISLITGNNVQTFENLQITFDVKAEEAVLHRAGCPCVANATNVQIIEEPVLYRGEVRLQGPTMTDNNMIIGYDMDQTCQIPLIVNNEETPEYQAEGDNVIYGDNVQTNEESPDVLSSNVEESQEQNELYDNVNVREGEDEDNQSVICIEDDMEIEENKVTVGDEQTEEETSSERPGEREDNNETEEEGSEEDEDDDDEDGDSVICVNEIRNPTAGFDRNYLRELVRKYFPQAFERERIQMRRDRNCQSQSDSENTESCTDDDNTSTEDSGDGNNPTVVCTEEDEVKKEGGHVQEEKKQWHQPCEEAPIEFVDLSNDEPEDNIFLIEPEEEGECQKPLLLPDNESEVDTDVGFKIGEARSLANTVIESESDEDSEPEYEPQNDVQSDQEEMGESDKEDLSEAEQIEADLADLGKIVARDERCQEPTANQTNSDQSVAPSVVATTEPEDQRRIWKTGPLEAQLSKNTKPLFECNVGDCPFATRLHYLFDDHIKNNHSSELWTGECEGCEGEVPGEEPLTIRAALIHLTNHVKQSESTHSAGMLESGDENIDELEAYQIEVTTQLERFQNEINDRRNLSTSNRPVQSEAPEENSSTNREEQGGTSDFNEECSYGNENLMRRVQDVQNVNPQVLGCEINCNEVGSAMESQIRESSLHVQAPVSDSSSSPPVLTPILPIESRTQVRNNTASISIPKTSENANSKRPAKAFNSRGDSRPQDFKFSKPSGSNTLVRNSDDFEPIPSTSKAAMSSSFSGFRSPQPSGSNMLVTNMDFELTPSNSKKSNSKLPAKGACKSLAYKASQSSGLRNAVRDSTDFEPIPSTSKAAMRSSSSPSGSGSPQSSESNTSVGNNTDFVPIPLISKKSNSKMPAKGACKSLAYIASQSSGLRNVVRDSNNFDPIPSTSKAAMSSFSFGSGSPQASGSNMLVRNSMDFDPTPSNSKKSNSKLPAKGICKSLAYKASQSSGLRNVVRDNTAFESTPQTPEAVMSSSCEFGSIQPSESYTLVRNSNDFEPIPSTSKAAVSSSPSGSGSSEPSGSNTSVRNNTGSVSTLSTSKKSDSKMPAKGGCKSLAYKASQSSGSRNAVRDSTAFEPTPQTSKAAMSCFPSGSGSPQPSGSNTSVGNSKNFEPIPSTSKAAMSSFPSGSGSPQPFGSNTSVRNSKNFEPIHSTSKAAMSSLHSSGFESSQPFGPNTLVKNSTDSVSIPSTSKKSNSKMPAKGGCKSLAYKSSQSTVLRNAVRDSTDVEHISSTSKTSELQAPLTSSLSSSSGSGSSQPSGSETIVRNNTDSVSISKKSDLQTMATSSPFILQFSQLSGYQTSVWNNNSFDPIPTTSRTFDSQALPNSPPFVMQFSQLPGYQTPVRNGINSVSIPTTSNSQIPAKGGARFRLVFESSHTSGSQDTGTGSSNSPYTFRSAQPSESQTPELSSQQGIVSSLPSKQSSSGNGSSVLPTRSVDAVIGVSNNEQRPVAPKGEELLKLKQQFQWHEISGDGVRPNPKTLQAIRESSPPSNHAELKEFLRLVRYCRRFIKGFSELSNALIKLSKQSDYVWNDSEQKSFDELKRIFMAEPILHFPDFNEVFILTSESSFNSLCSVLSQGEIENGRVIAYGSRKLKEHEEKFSTTEKELVGIVWGVKYFKPYLQKQSFKIVTTHEPLTWLINCEDLGGRMAKLRRELLQYQFKLIYCDRNEGSELSGAKNQSVSQSADTSRGTDPFEKFIKFHYTAKNIPKVMTQVTTHTSHTPLVLFYSKDLSNYNPLSHYIRNNFNFDLVKEPNNLYDVIELKNSEQTIYLCICRHFHFERLRYEDIFCSLRSLRNILDKNEYSGKIFLLDVTSKYKHIQQDMLSEIIVYAFRNIKVEATLLTIERKNPTIEEIRKILEENHRTSSNGHYGFRNTYARIKEKYKWNTMKYDIFNYIKHCRTCQDNETKYSVDKPTNFGFNRLIANILGPLPQTKNGNKYILTVQDVVTKYLYGVAVPNCDLQTVSQEYWKLCKQMTVFDAPRVIFSGQGTQSNDRVVTDESQNANGEQAGSNPIANLLANPPLPLHHSLLSHLGGSSKVNEWDAALPVLVLTDSAGYTPLEKLLLKTVLSRQTPEDNNTITID